MLKARGAVLRMKEYHPPLSGRQGLRLDFNENTTGCSPAVLARLREISADDLARYPERAPIEQRVATVLGLRAEQLLLTNGVDEGIHLLCETYLEPGDEAIIVTPTFSMYELCVQQTGASVIAVQADPADFAFPLERVLNAVSRKTRLIAFASPNNPTGGALPLSDMRKILRSVPHPAVLIDEAYFDFHGETMINEVGDFPNLFVARTFSKAYGLAGFRVGLLAANGDAMKVVRKVASPYNVNGVALACLEASISDQGFITQYVQQVIAGRNRLEPELRALAIPYWPSHANFVLARIGDRHAEFVQGMRERGILVRDRNNDPGCAGCVRITVGTAPQTEQLIHALREIAIMLGLCGDTQKLGSGR